jgi:hypothetical protein
MLKRVELLTHRPTLSLVAYQLTTEEIHTYTHPHGILCPAVVGNKCGRFPSLGIPK